MWLVILREDLYKRYNIYKKTMDLMYIENYSLFLDLKLIMMTIKILFMKESTEGVSEEKSETSESEAK